MPWGREGQYHGTGCPPVVMLSQITDSKVAGDAADRQRASRSHLLSKKEKCRKPQINQYTEEIYNEVDAQLYDTKINQA